MLNDDVALWAGLKDQMLITKADEKTAKGIFYFTASSTTTKTIEVTDGSFCILFPKK